MEFFNAKEDVLDIQLTQFGKHLLSKGEFKPKYYCFSDDDVIYDTAYVSGSEASFEAHKRIKSETPNLKTQYLFTGIETEFKRNNSPSLGNSLENDAISHPSSIDERKGLSFSLGSTDPTTNASPAYRIVFAKAPLSSSAISDEKLNIKNIPQLETVHKVETKIGMFSEPPKSTNNDIHQDASNYFFDEEEEFVFLDIKELGQLFQKENFDIEVYEYVTEENPQNVKVEKLRQLKFMPTNKQALKYASSNQIANAFPEATQDYVEYYFNVNVDEEIDDDVLCQVHFENKSEDIFADSTLEFECIEGLDEGVSSALPGMTAPDYNIIPPEDPC